MSDTDALGPAGIVSISCSSVNQASPICRTPPASRSLSTSNPSTQEGSDGPHTLTASGGRGDDPSGQPAVDGSTEQAAQPPATRAEHHILEGEADSDVDTDVDGVAESRQSSAAPTTATAAILALTTGDRGVGHPNKRVADDDDIDAFAEGGDQPTTAAVGRRKHLEDIVDDGGDGDNEPAREARIGPSRSARQTRRTRPPVPLAIESEELGEIGARYTVCV